jgi:hypothetical protein
MKIIQIAVVPYSPEENSISFGDTVYALTDGGRILILDKDQNFEWQWRLAPHFDEREMR